MTSQLLTAPPAAVATVGVLAGGYLAGRYNRRSPLLVIGSFIIAIGYLCLLVLYDKLGKVKECLVHDQFVTDNVFLQLSMVLYSLFLREWVYKVV